MVWDNDVRVIVMATELEEAGKTKCERYFPNPNRKVKYGDITITYAEATQCTGYIKSIFQIRRGGDAIISYLRQRLMHIGEAYDLTHYWYNTWPDHGVPTKDGEPYSGDILGITGI